MAVLLIGVMLLLRFKSENSQKMMLHLTFDENVGTKVKDSTGKNNDAEVHYIYNNAVYMDDREPEWRNSGVEGGSLLFDGCSTYIDYPADAINIGGDSFSISVWVAPRAFEWDDPNAAQNGTECLTSIASQYDKDEKQGFILGYQRFGRLSFQIGTGESWIALWADEARLKKYEWNFVTAVFDGTNGEMKLYLNGMEIGTKKIEKGTKISPAQKERLLIGKNSKAEQIAAGTYNMFAGLMDDLKLYSCALKKEDILAASAKKAPQIAFEDIWLENILTKDIYKTQYHGGPYQHWMNEPHAPLYYNGMYHLFYQCNMVGTYWRNICWGHLVSKDMVNWTPIKEAITPTENSVVPDGVVNGDLLYLRVTLASDQEKKFGIQLKTDYKRDASFFTYNLREKTISAYTKNKGSEAATNSTSGPLPLKNGKLTMEIYIDRSLIEAFFNDTKSISMRTYSKYDSQGIQLFADEDAVEVEELYVAEMKSIYVDN